MGVYRRNNKWWIDYRVQGRRKRECIGPSKRLAETVLAKRKAEIAENKFLDVKKQASIPFNEFASEYLEIYSKPNKRSWDRDEGIIKNLNGYFGKQCLHEISPQNVERYKILRSKDVSNATINKEIKLLKSITKKAVEWGRLSTNPISQIRLLKEDNHRLRYLNQDEIQRLLKACSESLKPIVIFALNTGLRRGEIKNLKWEDVDLEKDQICLLEQKNGRKEYVPLNETAKAVIEETVSYASSPYVFCDEAGKTRCWRTAYRNAMRRAGILNCRFHDLRHTFASHLAMSGVDMNTLRDLMRHKTFEMTLRYAHLSHNHRAAAVNRIGLRQE